MGWIGKIRIATNIGLTQLSFLEGADEVRIGVGRRNEWDERDLDDTEGNMLRPPPPPDSASLFVVACYAWWRSVNIRCDRRRGLLLVDTLGGFRLDPPNASRTSRGAALTKTCAPT